MWGLSGYKLQWLGTSFLGEKMKEDQKSIGKQVKTAFGNVTSYVLSSLLLAFVAAGVKTFTPEQSHLVISIVVIGGVGLGVIIFGWDWIRHRKDPSVRALDLNSSNESVLKEKNPALRQTTISVPTLSPNNISEDIKQEIPSSEEKVVTRENDLSNRLIEALPPRKKSLK